MIVFNFNIVHPFRVGTHPSNHETIPLFEVSTSDHKPDPSILDISRKNYVKKEPFTPRTAQNNRARHRIMQFYNLKHLSNVVSITTLLDY